MGHHCYICGSKLIGGLVPTCCDEIECLCYGCWDDILKVNMPIELQAKIRQEISDTGNISKKLLRQIKEWSDQTPECIECGTTLDETMCKDY